VKRFDCEYSIKSGNISLYFQANRRDDAERILGYYIGDLRELLRSREVESTSAAIESLKEEAGATPDPVLRTQLYETIAKQVERKKMAQVEADFAFRVIDPPAASDEHFKPHVKADCFIMMFLTVVGMVFLVLLLDKRANR
jgi:hypothetical protein